MFIETPRENFIATDITKQLNLYNFSGDLSFQLNHANLFLGNVARYARTLLQSADNSITETQQNYLRAGVFLTPDWALGGDVKYQKHTDSRTTTINYSSQSIFKMFSKYSLMNNWTVSLGSGYETNTQVHKTDKGLIWEANSVIENYRFFESDLHAQAYYMEENLSPRFNTNRKLAVFFNTALDEGLENSLQASYDQVKNDFYLPADTAVKSLFNTDYNIQNRTERTYSFVDNLTRLYLIPKVLSVKARVSVIQRTIDRDYNYLPAVAQKMITYPDKIEETKIEAYGGITYSIEKSFFSLSALFTQRDEKHSILTRQAYTEQTADIEAMKNNTAERISLIADGSVYISEADKFNYTISHMKLKYDTPSEGNTDDRDELLTIARLSYFHIFSPIFQGNIQIEGTLNKMVYISAMRSANNYTNRVLKLSGSTSYLGYLLQSVNSCEIASNYTVYDFEDIANAPKSFSFRQLKLSDSTKIPFSRDYGFRMRATYRIAEHGLLYWQEFATTPIKYQEEIYLLPECYSRLFFTEFAVGYRFFIVNSFRYSAKERILDNIFFSSGPSVQITANSTDHLSLTLSGWFENVSITHQQFYNQSNFRFDLLYKF